MPFNTLKQAEEAALDGRGDEDFDTQDCLALQKEILSSPCRGLHDNRENSALPGATNMTASGLDPAVLGPTLRNHDQQFQSVDDHVSPAADGQSPVQVVDKKSSSPSRSLSIQPPLSALAYKPEEGSTAQTYWEEDTGHVAFDLGPSVHAERADIGEIGRGNEEEDDRNGDGMEMEGEDQEFPNTGSAPAGLPMMSLDPQTPAAQVNPFLQKGSVIRDQDLFNNTQSQSPSTNLASPTSSLPSPNVYGEDPPPKGAACSGHDARDTQGDDYQDDMVADSQGHQTSPLKSRTDASSELANNATDSQLLPLRGLTVPYVGLSGTDIVAECSELSQPQTPKASEMVLETSPVASAIKPMGEIGSISFTGLSIASMDLDVGLTLDEDFADYDILAKSQSPELPARKSRARKGAPAAQLNSELAEPTKKRYEQVDIDRAEEQSAAGSATDVKRGLAGQFEPHTLLQCQDVATNQAVEQATAERKGDKMSAPSNQSPALERVGQAAGTQDDEQLGGPSEGADHVNAAVLTPMSKAPLKSRSTKAIGDPTSSVRHSARTTKASTRKTTHAKPRHTALQNARVSRRRSVALSEDGVDPLSSASPGNMTPSKKGASELFNNMAFAISYVDDGQNKARVTDLILQHGGTLLDGFNVLFGSDKAFIDEETPQIALSEAASSFGFVALVADEFSRKAKYMQALALGLPCISGVWVERCVAKSAILPWDPFLLAAGRSTTLNGAHISRRLLSYSAVDASLADTIDARPRLLKGKTVMIITGRGKAEETRRAYCFLARTLDPDRVGWAVDHKAARKKLLEAETAGIEWDVLYIVGDEVMAENAVFGALPIGNASKKRKRGPTAVAESPAPPPKRIRMITDEVIIQSVILGQLIDSAE